MSTPQDNNYYENQIEECIERVNGFINKVNKYLNKNLINNKYNFIRNYMMTPQNTHYKHTKISQALKKMMKTQ